MNPLDRLRLRRHFVSCQIDLVKQRLNAMEATMPKAAPFKAGDEVTAWSKHTMGGPGIRKVMDCQPMGGFASGYGVLTVCGKKPLWLCSSLFKKCNPEHAHTETERANPLF